MSKKPAKKVSKKPASKPTAKSAGGKKTTAKHAARTGSRVSGKKIAKKNAKKGGAASAGAKSTSAPASFALAKRAADLLRFAHKMVADMAAGIPDDRACEQMAGASNHKLWTLGHLAVSNQWFASLIDGQPLTFPAEWDKMFGMNSKPTTDCATYPPIADVRAAFEASNDRLCAAVESLSDAEIVGGPAGDGSNFVFDKLDSALKAVWHDGWHLGQIAALRKGMGLPSLMGG